MTGLFCFDGPLYKDKNGYYCSTTLTDEMFERYFHVVEKLYIVTRCFETDKTYVELNMKPLTLNNIQIIEAENLVSPKGLLFERKKFIKKIKSLVNKSDLIFARMPSIISNSILEIARRINKLYLVEVGGCAWDSYWNHSIFGRIVAPLMFYWERKYVMNAAFATYVTKQFLQSRYPNTGVNINCSNVYLQSSDERNLKERINKIDLCRSNETVIGQTVASVDVRYKGEHLIVKAMSKLKQDGIIVKYKIVGPGKGDYIIKQARKYGVENQIEFLGAMKKEEIFEWLKSIDIYVQPSKQEGLPRSVIEAMSVGVPCLGSNIAGIPELLDKECLFNPNKNSTIVEAIKRLLNRDTLKKQASINFKRAKEYNIEDIESKRKEIFLKYKGAVQGMEN